jgi:hypothetical protein
MIKITFEEHGMGMIEAQVYHSGEYGTKDMTAKEVFQIARDMTEHDWELTPKQKKERIKDIDRLEGITKSFGYMNIWYLFDWGRQWGGHRFHRMGQVSYEVNDNVKR